MDHETIESDENAEETFIAVETKVESKYLIYGILKEKPPIHVTVVSALQVQILTFHLNFSFIFFNQC